MTQDVVEFINKAKYVFDNISDAEIDIYNAMYNAETEQFIEYINKKYDELHN